MSDTSSKKRICLFALVIAYMVVIFAFSAQTADESSALSSGIAEPICRWIYEGFDSMPEQERVQLLSEINGFLRIMGHGTEFSGLCLLLSLLLGTWEKIGPLPICGGTRWAMGTLLSLAYAVTDEIHQMFVPGRACEVFDLSVDTIGAAIGGAIALVISQSVSIWRNK